MRPTLSPNMLEEIAQKFRVLGDPMRLRILHCLREGERTVTDIVNLTESSQPNVSKHLTTLRNAGLVTRRRESNQAYFAIAAPFIFDLCDIVCDGIDAELQDRRARLERERHR